MDEFTKKMIEKRKVEDEEFNKIVDARLKRQFAFNQMIKTRDRYAVSEISEEDEEEETYEVKLDENGDIEVNKTDQED